MGKGKERIPKGRKIPFGAPVSIGPLNLSIVAHVIGASEPAAYSLHLDHRPDRLETRPALIPLGRLAYQMALKQLSLFSLLFLCVVASLGSQHPLFFALLSFPSLTGVADHAFVFAD